MPGRGSYMDMVDGEHGLVDRRIFSDAAIYAVEMERIFARCWNFVAHESQIPNPGDFFMNLIGDIFLAVMLLEFPINTLPLVVNILI